MSKTSIQKNKVIEYLLKKPYLYLDKYNNIRYTNDNNIRFKIKKIALRKERKENGRWIKIWSKYYKDCIIKV